MAKRARGRARPFVGPHLQAKDPDLSVDRGADAEGLWRQGEQAEEAFDYEGARALYREAVRATSGRQLADWVTRYAIFLVERYGQFGEVAEWLDEDNFDPLLGGSEEGRSLAELVALAAAEVGHPRSRELDNSLARQHGHVDALARVAKRLINSDARDEALELLNSFGKRLPALSEAGRLLSKLRQEDDSACSTALAAVEDALESHDAQAARLALDAHRHQWQAYAVFRSVETKVVAAERLAHAETLRQRIERNLDGDDLHSAQKAALELVASAPENPADRNTLQWIERQLSERRRDELIALIQVAEDAAGAIDLLSTLYADHGADVEIGPQWTQAWTLVREAADHDGPLAGAGEQLARVLELGRMLDSADATPLSAAVAAIERRWQGLRIVRQSRAALLASERQARLEREAALIGEVEALLAGAELKEAADALRRHEQKDEERSPALRALHKRVNNLRLAEERLEARRKELGQRLAGDRLFGARRLLDKLRAEAEMEPAELATLHEQVQSRWDERMKATAVPPMGLSVSAEPLAVGVAAGWLLIVQKRLWLAVNLQTRGIQPFELPEACELSSRPAARIAEVDGKAVLIGFSRGRLIRMEQEPGSPPVVVDGVRLGRLLRGDDRISGAAIEPDARIWRLLHYHSDRPEAPASITEIDAATMEPLGVDRHRPALASLHGIRHQPDDFLAATTAEARSRRGWALALYNDADRGRPATSLSQQELVEPVARISAAIAWPDADRVFASYSVYDVFNPDEVQATSSLLVLRGGKLIFASADLRRRFAPTEPLIVDHPWTLDTHSGRLWFAALPRSADEGQDAMLIGVNAERLRSDAPVSLDGVARILAIEPIADGAVVLGRLHNGRLAVALARMEAGGDLALTIDGLPV